MRTRLSTAARAQLDTRLASRWTTGLLSGSISDLMLRRLRAGNCWLPLLQQPSDKPFDLCQTACRVIATADRFYFHRGNEVEPTIRNIFDDY